MVELQIDKCYSVDLDSYPGIIKITYKDDHDFTLADARLVLKDLEQITKGRVYPILKVPGKYSSIDNDARHFISSEEGMKCSLAEAIVTTFLPHRIIGNFYMNVNKPVKPTAFFETEEKALRWLKKFIV